MPFQKSLRIGIHGFVAYFLFLLIIGVSSLFAQSSQTLPGCWPQDYTVQRDDSTGLLTLATPYYKVQQNLRKGGAISIIKYT